MYQAQIQEEEKQRKEAEAARLAVRDEQIRQGNERYGEAAKATGSIAEKARMVQRYNETHKK